MMSISTEEKVNFLNTLRECEGDYGKLHRWFTKELLQIMADAEDEAVRGSIRDNVLIKAELIAIVVSNWTGDIL